MLLSYNSESKDWGGLLLGNLTKTIDVTDEVKTALGKLKPEYIEIANNMQNVAKKTGSTNAEYVKFLKGLKKGDITLKEGQSYLSAYELHLKKMSGGLDLANLKTKALSASMKILSSIGWMLAITLATEAISAMVQGLSDLARASEIAREKSTEFTEAWKEEKSALDDAATRYKELSESLKSNALSTDEVTSAKEELASIQQDLIDKYGSEASGIDLVNGKYTEQLGLLDKLTQKKAREYTAKNANNVEEDIKYLSKKFDLRFDTGFNGAKVFDSEINDIFEKYENIRLRISEHDGSMLGKLQLRSDGSVEDVYSQLVDLYHDLNSLANNDAQILADVISDALESKFDTEAIENAKNNVFEYSVADILDDSDTRELYDQAQQAVNAYNKAITSGEGVDEAKAQLDSVKAAIDNSLGDGALKEVYGAGQVFDEIWSGISTGAKESTDTLNNYKSEVLSFSEQLAEIQTLSDGLSQLGKIYADVADGEGFDFSSIIGNEDFSNTFSSYTDEYNNFLKTISSSPNDINACQGAFNSLVSAYIRGSDKLDNLTEENKAYTIALLEQEGVLEATAIVEAELEAQRIANKYALNDLTNAINVDIEALLNEESASDLTRSALFNLVSDQTVFNNSTLDTTDKIKALENLAVAFGIVSDSANKAVYSMELEARMESLSHIGLSTSELEKIRAKYEEYYLNKAESDYRAKFASLVNNYDGGKNNKNSSFSSSSSSSDTYFDWVENKLDHLNDELEKTKEQIEDTFNWDVRIKAIDDSIVDANVLKEQLELAKERYMQEAKKSGLSQPYIELVQTGKIDLLKLSNDDPLKEQIESYQKWYEKVKQCDEELDKLNSDIDSLYSDKRSLKWEIFDYLEDSISRITDESEYLIELLSSENLFDDKGGLTEYGNATLGLHISNLKTYQQQAKDYYEEMKSLESQLATGGQEVLDKFNERADAHRDMVSAIVDEKNAILDLMEEGYQKQLDYLNDIIDKKKESLNAERDLYDYQKSIQEKSDKVSSLQKQYDIYSQNTMSEEDRTKAQKIKVELEEAKADLEEAEYDKYLSDQESMLDAISLEYEEWMNARLDNENILLQGIIDKITTQGDAINTTLQEIASKYNTTISDSISTSVDGNTNGAINNLINSISKLLGGNANLIGNVGGYASGTSNTRKGWHWTQENGEEIIIRKSDGAMLTPLGDGDIVFNNESSKLLYEFSKNPSEFISKLGLKNSVIMPNISMPDYSQLMGKRTTNIGDININLGGIQMEGVSDPKEFADNVADALANSTKVQKVAQAITLEKALGKNSLNKLKY